MTHAEIIEEIKRRYPVGTVFIPLGGNKPITVLESWKVCFSLYFINRSGARAHSGYIWDGGDEWAEIINSSARLSATELLREAKRRYPVGTKYKTAYEYSYGTDSEKVYTVEEQSFSLYYDDANDLFIHAEDNKGVLYCDDENVWAEIITEDKPEYHNPDGVTPEQVGEGYRLLYPSEIDSRSEQYESINCWYTHSKKWTSSFRGSDEGSTYRVPAYFPKDFTEEYIKQYEAFLIDKEEISDVLKYGDKVVFILKGEVYEHLVSSRYLVNKTDGVCNSAIFTALGLNRHTFCTKHYDYAPDAGEWPECKEGDYEALTRVVNALHEECRKANDAADKPSKYKVGDLVRLTERCHCVEPQKVTIRAIAEDGYNLDEWEGVFPERVLAPIESEPETYKGFEVGKVYRTSNGLILTAYFCGLNNDNLPVFELINIKYGVEGVSLPKNWTCKASGCYWAYKGLEKHFDNTPITTNIINPTNIINTVPAAPSGVVVNNPTILVSTQNEKITSRGSISFNEHSSISTKGIVLPRVNLEIREGDPIRGTGFKGATVQITIGNRHRDN